jgi:hypothetical protein
MSSLQAWCDAQLEHRIRELTRKCQAAKGPAAEKLFAELQEAIAKRSPEQIERMEKARGLRSA